MTREHKISLIVGFALVLLVAVAVSDHLSSARSARLETGLADAGGWAAPIAPLPEPIRGAPLPGVGGTNAADPTPDPDGLVSRGLADAQPEPGPPTERPGVLDRLRERFTTLTLAGAVDTLPTTPDPTDPGRTVTPSPADTPIVWHAVAEGESLWSIAEAHYGDGSLYRQLAAYNAGRVPEPDAVRAGVRLRIPPRSALDGSRPPTSATSPSPSPSARPGPPTPTRAYTIRPGDTLGEIAQRELGTVRRLHEILALNPTVLTDPDIAPIGVTIRLPAR